MNDMLEDRLLEYEELGYSPEEALEALAEEHPTLSSTLFFFLKMQALRRRAE